MVIRNTITTTPHRAAVGLVLVLIVLTAVCATMTAALTLVGQTERLVDRSARQQQLRHLLIRGEALAVAWIRAQGPDMVLDPAHPRDGLLIVDDRLADNDDRPPVTLTVEVFDGFAGLPAHLVAEAAPLAPLKPMVWHTVPIPAGERGRPERISDLLAIIDTPAGLRRFPASRSDRQREEPALASWLAPHSDGRVNINTAAPDLLGDLFALTGGGDAGTILDRRRQGLWTRLAPRHAGDDLRGLRLVDRSACWNCLITVRRGERRQRWWTVFARSDEGVARIQRHDVDG